MSTEKSIPTTTPEPVTEEKPAEMEHTDNELDLNVEEFTKGKYKIVKNNRQSTGQ